MLFIWYGKGGTRYCTLTASCYRGDFTQNQAVNWLWRSEALVRQSWGGEKGTYTLTPPFPLLFCECMMKTVHRRQGFYSYRILEIINHVLLFDTMSFTKKIVPDGIFWNELQFNLFHMTHFLVHWSPASNTLAFFPSSFFPLSLIIFYFFPFYFISHFHFLFIFKIKSRAGEMALLVKSLVCKHKGLSLILRIHLKTLV